MFGLACVCMSLSSHLGCMQIIHMQIAFEQLKVEHKSIFTELCTKNKQKGIRKQYPFKCFHPMKTIMYYLCIKNSISN